MDDNLKIEKGNAKIYTKFLLYKKSVDEIKNMLDNKEISYRALLSSIYDLLNNNRIYFLLNDGATSKVRELINLKRFDTNSESLTDEFNNAIIKANEIDSIKNREKNVRLFARRDLTLRTLDERYSVKKSNKEEIEDLKLLLLELQSFDYQYIKMIKYREYDSIDESNFRTFLSSTNYLLEVEPEIFVWDYPSKIVKFYDRNATFKDNPSILDCIISIIEEYKNCSIKTATKTLKKLK